MSATTIDSTTGRGIRSVTAYLAVRPAIELIEFVKQAFGARELLRTTGTGGGTHAEVQIGDTKVMIGGGGAWGGTPTPTALHLYVPDADRVYQAALAAGAVSLRSPVDQPYGDREASVRDLAGNHWYIATHQEGSHVPEGLAAVTPYLHPRGAPELIDFLKRAFAAEEMAVHRAPEGTIVHAKIRVGGSVIEMGEAHDKWGPMPTMFYLYVDDVDAWYRRASPPAPHRWKRRPCSPMASGVPRCATRSATRGTWPRRRRERVRRACLRPGLACPRAAVAGEPITLVKASRARHASARALRASG